MAIQVTSVGGPEPLPQRPAARPAPSAAPATSAYSADSYVPSSGDDARWLEQKKSEMLQGKILDPQDAARYYRLSRAGVQPAPAPSAPLAPPQAPQPPAAPVSIPGLTAEEVAWVQQLAAKVQGGIEPTPDEVQRYQMLNNKAAAAQGAAAPPAPAAAPAAGPSADDAAWAANLEARVQQGQQPTPEEIARYQRIKGLASASAPAPAAPTSPAGVPAIPGLTSEEVLWVQDLAKRVQAGAQPTPEELQRYQMLNNKAAAAQGAPGTTGPAAAPAAGPPSAQELQWAAALEQRVQQGAMPSQDEINTYNAIQQRKGGQEAAPTAASPSFQVYTPFLKATAPPATPPQAPATPPAVPLSNEELAWVQGLEEQVRLGYQMSPQESQALAAMKARQSAASGGSPDGQALYTQAETQWAQTIEAAVAQGYQPAPNEAQAYQDIKRRFLLEQQRRAAAPRGMAVSTLEVEWAAAIKKRIETGYQPNPQEAQALQDIARRLMALQQAAGGTAAPLPATANAPASPAEQQYAQVNWQQWSQPVGGPAAVAPAAQPIPAVAPQLPTLSIPATLAPINAEGKPLPIAPPTPMDRQWATQLEQQVQQGYQPSPEEIQRHDDVYKRLQASGQPQPGGGGFLSKLKQGFQNLMARFKKPAAPQPQ